MIARLMGLKTVSPKGLMQRLAEAIRQRYLDVNARRSWLAARIPGARASRPRRVRGGRPAGRSQGPAARLLLLEPALPQGAARGSPGHEDGVHRRAGSLGRHHRLDRRRPADGVGRRAEGGVSCRTSTVRWGGARGRLRPDDTPAVSAACDDFATALDARNAVASTPGSPSPGPCSTWQRPRRCVGRRPPRRRALVLFAVGPGLALSAGRRFAFLLRGADELVRRIQTRALGAGFAAGLAVSLFYPLFAERAPPDQLPASSLAIAMMPTAALGLWRGMRRYAAASPLTNRLRVLRAERGWSQAELAAAAGRLAPDGQRHRDRPLRPQPAAGLRAGAPLRSGASSRSSIPRRPSCGRTRDRVDPLTPAHRDDRRRRRKRSAPAAASPLARVAMPQPQLARRAPPRATGRGSPGALAAIIAQADRRQGGELGRQAFGGGPGCAVPAPADSPTPSGAPRRPRSVCR